MQVCFCLLVVLEKKFAAFDSEYPLSPADFITGGKEKKESQQSPCQHTQVILYRPVGECPPDADYTCEKQKNHGRVFNKSIFPDKLLKGFFIGQKPEV